MNYRFFPRNRVFSLVRWGCALLLLASLTARVLWHAARTETGLEILRSHGRDATIGWVLADDDPVPMREPSKQAEHWLREVDRVLRTHPRDPELTMGAALVLDSPGIGYEWRYMTRLKNFPGFLPIPDINEERIKRAEDAFEKRCKHRCLELAATAARLDPTDVHCWRLYALLLQRHSLHSFDDTPRDPDWVRILNECARHDPDNALYDYLAANFYWTSAARRDFSSLKERLVIKDGDKFKEGIVRFEQGQAKRYFAVGDKGFTAVATFLSHTPTPLTDYDNIVNSRAIHLGRSGLLRHVWRWQDLRADEKASAGDPAAALMLHRQNLHMIGQYERGGASDAYDQMVVAWRTATAWQMQAIAEAHRDAISEPERQEIVVVKEAAILQREIAKCAARDFAKLKGRPATTVGLRGRLALASVFLVGVLPSLVVLLLFAGLLATILSRHSPDTSSPVVGPVAQVFTLAIATTATVVLFGLAPAEFIGRSVQSWFFTVGLLLMPLVVVAWIGWCWLRRRAFQFSIRAMLILTLLVSLFFGLVQPDASFFSVLPFPLSIPARGWKTINAAVFGNVITGTYGKWPWAVSQWTAYYGPHLTMALWTGLIAILYRRRIVKSHRNAGDSLPCLRNQLGGLFHSLARPALVLLTFTLIAYLLLVPITLDQVEQEFQKKMAFARHPQSYWTEVERAVQRVRADTQLMGQLSSSAKAEAAMPANPDSGTGPP